ncbi:MAG: hypothetical protein QG559_804 [Campylobacterota bacterium]|nr:hypothetical protein [Campylobacterota bacterium]
MQIMSAKQYLNSKELASSDTLFQEMSVKKESRLKFFIKFTTDEYEMKYSDYGYDSKRKEEFDLSREKLYKKLKSKGREDCILEWMITDEFNTEKPINKDSFTFKKYLPYADEHGMTGRIE